MTVLALVITKAGLDRFTAAQLSEDIDLTVSDVGVTDAVFVAAPTLTALPGEIRRVDTISGDAIGDNIVHMTVRDDAEIGYTVRGFGLFLADGTLFAAYSSPDVIIEKSPSTSMFLAIDIAFPTSDIAALTFGDTNFLNPPATTETAGVIELATDEEAALGTDTRRAIVPAVLKARLAQLLATVNQALAPLVARTINGGGLVTGGGDLSADRILTVDAASAAEAIAGTLPSKAMTPATDLAALEARLGAGAPTTFIKTLLAAATVAAARSVLGLGNVATRTMGAGNGIDADKLDGIEGADYLRVSSGSNAAGSWRIYSDGMIEQWGSATVNGNGDTTIMLPMAFPTQCLWQSVAGGNPDADAKDNNPFAATPFPLDRIVVHNAYDNGVSAPFYAKGF